MLSGIKHYHRVVEKEVSAVFERLVWVDPHLDAIRGKIPILLSASGKISFTSSSHLNPASSWQQCCDKLVLTACGSGLWWLATKGNVNEGERNKDPVWFAPNKTTTLAISGKYSCLWRGHCNIELISLLPLSETQTAHMWSLQPLEIAPVWVNVSDYNGCLAGDKNLQFSTWLSCCALKADKTSYFLLKTAKGKEKPSEG